MSATFRFPRVRTGYLARLAALVLMLCAGSASLSAQAPNVSPDGGSLQGAANKPGQIATFQIWQWSGSSVVFNLTCAYTGSITGCAPNWSVTVPCCGQQVSTQVWYTGGAPGAGTIRLTARHAPTGMTDQGSYNVTLVNYSVAVTPDGGTQPARPLNTSGHTASFIVRNTGQTSNTFSLACSSTSPVTCAGVNPASVTLGSQVESGVTVTYNVGGEGNGTLTLTATGTNATDQGSFSVPVVNLFAPSSVTAGVFTKDGRYLLQETANTYDAHGRLTQLEDARTKRTNYEYGGNANSAFLTKVTRLKDASGPIDLVTDIAYDGSGFVQSIRDEGGSMRSFSYDAFGRLRRIMNNGGVPVKAFGYAYSRSGPSWVFNAASPNAIVDTTFVQYGPNVSLVSTSYLDGLGRPIQSVVQDGSSFVVSANEYDPMGRPWRAWKPYSRPTPGFDPGFEAAAAVWYNAYHPEGQVKPFTETEYRADPLARVTRETPPYLGASPNGFVAYAYGVDATAKHAIVEVSDAAGKKTRRFSDVFGNPVKTILGSETPSDSSTTLLDFDVLGQHVKTTDPRGLQTAYTIDTRGLLTSKASPDAGTVSTKYDKAGNLRYSQDANQAAAGKVFFTTYDFANRALTSGLGPATFASLDPDAASAPALETTESNWLIVRAYDAKPTIGLPWNLFSAEIASVTLANVGGRVAAVGSKSNGAWQVSLFSYDADGRVSRRHTFTQAHGGGSVLASVNTQVEYERDLRDAVTKRALTVGSNTFNHWYDYDNRGLLWKVFASTAPAKPATPDVTFTYRPSGQVQDRQFQGGPVVPVRYTIREELEKIGNPGDVSFPFSARYAYHPNGNVWESEFHSPGSPAPAKRYKYEFAAGAYDALNRLRSANFSSWNGSWTSTLAHDLEAITYDRSGNLFTLKRYRETGSLIDNLSYVNSGSSNQLTWLSDAVGTTPETWDAETGAFSYDANGNVIAASAPYAITAVTYDHQNLPVSLTSNGVASSYRYDGAGQRITKQVAGGNTELYLLDGASSLGVVTVNGSGTPTSWFFNVLAGDRVIGRQPNVGNRRYYHPDLLGSTRAVVEGATIVESYDPEPWGLLMPGRTLGSGTKEGFTGKERDAESGLDYFGARLYMAALGRWTSVDPLFEKHPEWSPYNYVLNNPLGLFDPDGRQLAPRHALPITPIMIDIRRGAGGRTAADWEALAVNKGVPLLQEIAISQGLGALAQRLVTRLGAIRLRGSSAPRGPAIHPGSATPPPTAPSGTQPMSGLGDDAAQGGIGTRYMGLDEADEVARTGTIPAVNRRQEPKKIHYTTDPPTTSASAAQKKYKLDDPPTHMCQFPTCNVQDNVAPDGAVAPGATQAATSKPIPGAKKPKPLDP
jgi:RHS repeat-associated protein